MQAQTYFDSLVISQVNFLVSSHRRLSKILTLDNETDSAVYTPGKIQWENELDVFRQLGSFEKPAYRQAYVVRDRINDPASNLLIKSYESSKAVPVRELRFYYYQHIENLKKIEGVYEEKNALFTSSRTLMLEFSTDSGISRLTGYSIKGIQKIPGNASVSYTVTGTVSN